MACVMELERVGLAASAEFILPSTRLQREHRDVRRHASILLFQWVQKHSSKIFEHLQLAGINLINLNKKSYCHTQSQID